ncbi:hypothetical protein [Mucilaginibacter agri]|uniref:Uncharacterized protein n=1 Tax=Mucilaginibacter agri TaxID=2695265 RepID=A0A965ZGQ7_9SPHI|nr:hypothetical protein [Mucilaginibacter agri]NCD69436.1 hypothetical protein [Mucilaginibacter agri]
MKKVLCFVALAAICSGSVFAHSADVIVSPKTTLAQDTVKKKTKTKNEKTKTKTKTKKDTTKTPTM